MDESILFWSRLLRSYLGGGQFDPERETDGGIQSLLEVGRRTHLIGLPDVMRSQGDPADNDWPETLMTASKRDRSLQVRQNRIYRELIGEFDDKARDHGLRYAWLKGAVELKENNYPKGVRRLSDLDLLVKKDDLRIVHEQLNDLGYETYRDPDWILSQGFSPHVSSTFYTREHGGMNVLIDLHWHLVDYPARRASGYWNFSMEPVFERIEEDRLNPEHRILYTIDHAFTHNFEHWKFLLDLYFLLRNNGTGLDWEFLKSEADRMNLDRILSVFTEWLYLLYEGETEGTPFEVITNKLNGSLDPPRNYVRTALNLSSSPSDYLSFCLRLLPDLSMKWRFVRYLLFPPLESVPMVRSDSSRLMTARLYFERLGRVLKGALGI